jgi:hypothetical protein
LLLWGLIALIMGSENRAVDQSAQAVLRVLDAMITGAISDSFDGIGLLRSPATAQRIGTRPLRCGEAEDLDLC